MSKIDRPVYMNSLIVQRPVDIYKMLRRIFQMSDIKYSIFRRSVPFTHLTELRIIFEPDVTYSTTRMLSDLLIIMKLERFFR